MLDIRLFLDGQSPWDLSLLAVLICLACCYLFLVQRYSKMVLGNKQTFLFLLGFLLFYFTIGSPFAVISHLSFSLHMIQMSILYFIIPPLLLLGIPERLFIKAIELPKPRWIKKCKVPPKIALYIFAVLLFLYHLPFILTFLSTTSLLQNGYITILFSLSFTMWSPIASPDSKRQLCRQEMKRYAMTSGYVLMPACLFFIVAAFIGGIENPLFTQLTAHLCIPGTSNAITVLPPPFNTKYDQFMAGIVMMGLHKLGLVGTLSLQDKIVDPSLKSETNESYKLT
ncbi:cytochrome c oxidase assembly protein [Sporosarcina sp. SAFN-015]|uniref:cytochrome c oxidase assembly protein n=1 Tax=Sporosarcina sp. SAFN-015 TaxID=3387274 RepID=UPI003F81E378